MYKHRKMSAKISNEVTLNLEIDLGTVDIFMVLHLFICDLCLFFLLKLAFSPNNLHENLVCCLQCLVHLTELQCYTHICSKSLYPSLHKVSFQSLRCLYALFSMFLVPDNVKVPTLWDVCDCFLSNFCKQLAQRWVQLLHSTLKNLDSFRCVRLLPFCFTSCPCAFALQFRYHFSVPGRKQEKISWGKRDAYRVYLCSF